ncbi:MAG TPA: GtrA family protein [Sporolactobacillaceae bacterium]|nr:GtrA family protein [Sporolactobacillaceae bacterium]
MRRGLIRGFIQYIKFGAVGLTSGALDLGSLNLLLFIWPTSNHVLLVIFNTFAYDLAVLNSYIWNSRYTFKEGNSNSHGQKVAFILQAIISLFISDGVLYVGTSLLTTTHWFPKLVVYNIAKLLSMFLSSLASFFFMKFFVFRKKSSYSRA